MALALANTSNYFNFHKNLSDWLNEETEHVFQRLERWAACARGYNRLGARRYTRGRPGPSPEERDQLDRQLEPQQEQQQSQSNGGPLGILRRSEAGKSPSRRSEQMKLNCCGRALNYKSNGNLNSNCLETYSYDHSIYFKTIGEIKSTKHASNNNNNNSDQEVRTPSTEESTSSRSLRIDDNDSDEKIEFERPVVQVRSPQSPREVLDCGDFLASDFDDLDGPLGDEILRIPDLPITRSNFQLVFDDGDDFVEEDDIVDEEEFLRNSPELAKSRRKSDILNNNFATVEINRFDLIEPIVGNNRRSSADDNCNRDTLGLKRLMLPFHKKSKTRYQQQPSHYYHHSTTFQDSFDRGFDFHASIEGLPILQRS